jgi:hypothetical protein
MTRTVISTYHVFGSGGAGCLWYQLDDSLADLVSAMDDARASAVDDGHNGFIGTRSVEPEWQARHPQTRVVWWAHPGREAQEIPGQTATCPAHARAGLARGLTRVSDLYDHDSYLREVQDDHA